MTDTGDDYDLVFVGCVHGPSEVKTDLEAFSHRDFKADALETLDVSNLPITVEHDEDKGVGQTLEWFNGDDGSKLVMGVIVRDTNMGKKTARKIEKGKWRELSLSDKNVVADLKIPTGSKIPGKETKNVLYRRREVFRLGVTDKGARPNCFIYPGSLTRIPRNIWDPNRRWANIRTSVNHNSYNKAVTEISSSTSSVPNLNMADAEMPSQPPAAGEATGQETAGINDDVLGKLAAGHGSALPPEQQASALQSLARMFFETKNMSASQLAELKAQNEKLAQELQSTTQLTRESVMDMVKRAQQQAQDLEAMSKKFLREEEEAASADGQVTPDESTVQKNDAHHAAELELQLLNTLNPEQLRQYGRVREIQVHCNAKNQDALRIAERELKAMQDMTMKAKTDPWGQLSNVNSQWGARYGNSVSSNASAPLASTSARFPSQQRPASSLGASASEPPTKRANTADVPAWLAYLNPGGI